MSSTDAGEAPATPQRTALVPDLDGEILRPLEIAEEVLSALDDEAGPEEPLTLTEPLTGGRALAAVERLWEILKPTQSRPGDGTGRLLAPDGRYEHAPLSCVQVDQEDIDAVAAAARVLGKPAADTDLAEAVGDVAAAYDTTREDLAFGLARVTGLLDLEWTLDAEHLSHRITSTGAGDVVFTATEEAAYRATVDRINTMWALGSDTDRFLY